ncbi:MAG: hypothetical protein F2803_05740 [Actinobacteria bacterium]|nr:hypothetical protein [Actinomycetota bacterium]
MRIATWNIMHAEHVRPEGFSDPERAFQAAISALGADYCGLQEVDYFHPRTKSINQAGFAADSGSYPYWAFAPAFTVKGEKQVNISRRSPHVQTNAHNSINPAYGIAILSKVPVAQWLHKKLPTALWGGYLTFPINGKPTRFYAKDHSRVALAARFDDFILINTHLSFVPFFARVQLRTLISWAKKLEKRYKIPVVLIGDLNLSRIPGPWKSVFSGFTFPVWAPERQIDFILSRSGQCEAAVIEGFETSDHAALIAEISL